MTDKELNLINRLASRLYFAMIDMQQKPDLTEGLKAAINEALELVAEADNYVASIEQEEISV